MAIVYFRIGSMDNVIGYDTDDFDSAIETDQPIAAGLPINLDHVMRLADVQASILPPKSVANIASPTELNTVVGTAGALIIVYKVNGATVQDEYTIYAYDASGPAVNMPYVVDASGAGNERWIAIGGKYSTFSNHTIASHSDANLSTISNKDLIQWDDPSTKWLPKSIDEIILNQAINPGAVTIGSKGLLTTEGGFAVKLTNKTGGNSVKGEVVTPYDSSAIDNAVKKIIVDVPNPIGVFYESGIADGAEAWVVVSGIADVYFIGNTTRGHIARGFLTADAGYVTGQALSEAYPSSPFSDDKHFYEIGHVLESRVGAGLAKCVLHFN